MGFFARIGLVLALTQPLSAFGVTAKISWSQTITVGKDQTFLLKTILPAQNGGVAVFGTVDSNLRIKQELRVQGLSSAGTTQWIRTLPSLDGAVSHYLVDAVAGIDHEFYTVETIHYGNQEDPSDTLLTHLSANGEVLWQTQTKGLNGLSNYAIAMLPDREGGVFIAGIDTIGGTDEGQQSQCFFQHYNRQGQLRWQQSIADLEHCAPASFGGALAVDAEGSLYVALENALVKFDSEGQELWRIHRRSYALSIFQDRLYVTSPQESWAVAFDGTLQWSLPDQGGVYLSVAQDGMWTAGTVFSDEGEMRVQLQSISRDGRLNLQQSYLGGEKSIAQGLTLNSRQEPIVFADVWTKQGLFKIPQQEMNLLSFDQQGGDLWQAKVKGSLSGASFLPLDDKAYIVGDLMGLVSRLDLVDKPACPWWNPGC